MNTHLQTKNFSYNALQCLWIFSSPVCIVPLILKDSSFIPQCLLLDTQGTFITIKKKRKKRKKKSHRSLNPYFIPGIAFIYLILWNLHNNHDRYNWGSEGDALQPKLPGFRVRMWGQRIPCTINAYVAYAAEDRFCSGDEPNHTACCPSLNSAAQPWPLPGCNHSPGGSDIQLITHHKGPFTLPHRAGRWATLALSGSREHVHNHKGSNRLTCRALLSKVSCYSSTAGAGVKAWGLTQVLQGSGGWG